MDPGQGKRLKWRVGQWGGGGVAVAGGGHRKERRGKEVEVENGGREGHEHC